jgi:hypothetical protein
MVTTLELKFCIKEHEEKKKSKAAGVGIRKSKPIKENNKK